MDLDKFENKRFRNSKKFLVTKEDLEELGNKDGFELEFLELDSLVKGAIKECEGKHIQQISYSSYHDALTQVCFGCKKIRTSLKKEDLESGK